MTSPQPSPKERELSHTLLLQGDGLVCGETIKLTELIAPLPRRGVRR